MYDQMYVYLNKILSKFQCGFRRRLHTAPCSMWFALPSNHDRKMVPVFRQGGISGALLTDLSKAFDCLLHDFVIPKLAVSDFDYDSGG